MDKISKESEYAITHIQFKDSLATIKSNIAELEKLMLKMSNPNTTICSYIIEKTKWRYNIFTFNTTEYDNLKALDTTKQFRNLTESETVRFFTLVEFFDRNDMNGMMVDNGAVLFNYNDYITMPTNWTERTIIVKRNNSSTKNWIDISDKITETNDFALLDEL